jgi:hypothetical protein
MTSKLKLARTLKGYGQGFPHAGVEVASALAQALWAPTRYSRMPSKIKHQWSSASVCGTPEPGDWPPGTVLWPQAAVLSLKLFC